MNNNYSAIVLGIGATGLGAIRGLGREKIPTCLIAYSDKEIALKSRYPAKKIALKSTNQDDKRKELFEVLDGLNANLTVLPTSDWFVSAFTEYQESRNNRFRSCMPDRSITEGLIDKALETRMLEGVLSLPKTVQELPEDVSILQNNLRLPIIFKPRSHLHFVLGRKNIRVEDESQLVSFYKKFGSVLHHIIAQEVIPGDDSALWVCNCTFDRESNIVGAFVFRRLSLSPPHFGVTSYAISEYNQTIVDKCQTLGKSLNYQGTAMIEFKFDHRDNDYKYIELNPRLGLCNYFDTRCGINNVLYTYLLASQDENMLHKLPAQQPRQRNNVIFASVFEDFYSRKQDGQSLSSILRTYMADAAKPHVYIYFALEDAVPGIVMVSRDLSRILTSLFKKLFRIK